MRRLLIVMLIVLFVLPAAAQRANDTFGVYFDLNVPQLNSNGQKRIDLLIYNDKIISGAGITIIGYADYLGTEGHNKTLSLQRAENVKAYLIKYGISAADIKICMGKGEIERQGMSSKEGSPADRRVDIAVSYRKGKPLKTAKATIPPTRTDTAVRKVPKAPPVDITELNKLHEGSVFLLKNVYFPPNQHVLSAESFETLQKLYDVLQSHPGIKISIEGHVCCIREDVPDALDVDNGEPTLSANRARAIYNYLTERGIDAKRLSYIGYGRRRPVIKNELTAEDQERNRRVEIRIVENK